jgi:hypothetical protein
MNQQLTSAADAQAASRTLVLVGPYDPELAPPNGNRILQYPVF